MNLSEVLLHKSSTALILDMMFAVGEKKTQRKNINMLGTLIFLHLF